VGRDAPKGFVVLAADRGNRKSCHRNPFILLGRRRIAD
jgi:hypothetical protein